ncbi:hypothetical protein EVAR_82076_1 [Eumeta japonica]|uniref:Uncharacterized protein n=1 Tax=Eumeta variegata TaxID=151549 RepID=A0A4C1U1G5_EUMVA|nr:hypothetical protein EVAR_82076_1 [Eumeta japonica]
MQQFISTDSERLGTKSRKRSLTSGGNSGAASRIPVATGAVSGASGDHRLAKCASWSGDGPLSPDPADLTPALRRRRQNTDKYAADPARELNLRFARPRHRHPPAAAPTIANSQHNRCGGRGVPSLLMSSPPGSGASSSSCSPPPAATAAPAPPPAEPPPPGAHNAARARRFRPLSAAP